MGKRENFGQKPNEKKVTPRALASRAKNLWQAFTGKCGKWKYSDYKSFSVANVFKAVARED